MTTDTVKYTKMTTESVVDFMFFETLTTEKSATGGVQNPENFADVIYGRPLRENVFWGLLHEIRYLPCIRGRYVSKRTILCNRPLEVLFS